MKKLSYKAFTLVEMLIVIVIIGILAAALIPKLQGMQGRARDTARKADLGQIGTAFAVYYADNGRYPGTNPASNPNSSAGNVNDLSGTLVPAIMSSIPKDPNATRYFYGVSLTNNGANETGALGSYRYSTLYRNGREGHAFILMAGTEEGGSSSNYIYSTTTDVTNVTTGSIFDTIKSFVCPSVTRAAATDVKKCEADQTKDILRYAYIN